jgi:hypothetical protein
MGHEMYVHMYVFMYVHMYVIMYVHMYVFMYIRMYVHMYVCMYQGADKSLARDQEGNGTPDTCNPEETGLPGLPLA